MFDGVIYGDAGEKGLSVVRDHFRMGAQFGFFNFFNKLERVFANEGAFFYVGSQDVVEEGCSFCLGSFYVVGYEAGIMRRFVGLDGRVSGGGDGP